MNKKDEKLLRSWEPCRDGLAWGLKQKSLYDVYRKCERSDWLLWLISKSNPLTKEQAVRIAIACAERVLKYAKCAEAKLAIDAAKSWLENPCEKTRDAARAARYAGAAGAAAWAAAWAAAGAAAGAARAAGAAWAARAARYVAWAARDAADAAWAAARASAGAAERKWQADAIRKIVKNPFKAERGRKP